MKPTDKMVDRFLAWPLPVTVRPDGKDGDPHRCGTNLLTAIECRQMLEHVLQDVSAEPAVSLAPIRLDVARATFKAKSEYRGDFNLAIAARDDAGNIHGVIALVADGDAFSLGHIYTDGSAQIGSLLYGGAWRAAKALGYKSITI